MIIGAQLYESLRTGKTIKHQGLHLVCTAFGYVISGVVKQCKTIQSVPIVHHVQQEDTLRRFWKIEEVSPPKEKFWTYEEAEATKHYDRTTRRDDEGRFVVEMPFVKPTPRLGESYQHALTRFEAQERRLHHNANLRDQYRDFINEFKSLGHLEKVPDEEINNGCQNRFYLPHHAVLKESSTTTKLRVVFDGSAKTSTGTSLNDILLVGPTLQPDIFDLLIRFRQYMIGMTADVAKMSRQIALAPNAKPFHRILWRDEPTQKIEHLQMTRVTYGIASSAYHSIRSLRETAKSTDDERVTRALVNDFYVDDFLSGSTSLVEAEELQDRLIKTLDGAKMQLRKWVSNHPRLIERLPEELRGSETVSLLDSSTIKTLGITWEYSTDHFKFDLCLPEITPPVTKREILSEVAKQFDPIGWFAPITIKCKMWIQRLWTLGLAWDQPIPAELASEFIRDMQDFGHLRGFRLQRFISTANPDKHEIHCFADASINAYATVVYLVTETANQERTSHLIAAKTRVAPIKTVSLPRLELCAAQLSAKHTSKIVTAFNCLDLRNLEVFAWSDSTITLAWIKALPSKWNTFVANRVSDIQTHLPPSHWHHVPTKLNPADVASRGSTAGELIKDSLWWHGPEFLRLSAENWPPDPSTETNLEQRKVKKSVHVVSKVVTILEHERFSDFKSLRNTQAYILRFIKQLKSKTPMTMALSAQELEDAKLQILRDHQAQFFTK